MTEFLDSESSRNLERRSFSDRVLIFVLLAFLLTIVVLLRLYYLQVHSHEDYKTQSQNNRIQIQSIAPPRGAIFDTHGRTLADNRQVLSLAIVPESIQDLEETLEQLKQFVDLPGADLAEIKERIKRNQGHDPLILKRDLTLEEQAALAILRPQLVGVVVTNETIRHYLHGELLVHAIGSVRRITLADLRSLDAIKYRGTQFIGGTGVERFYERSLHGQVGSRSVEIDASGRPTDEKPEKLIPPQQGASITLHLDFDLQVVADEALGDRRGAVVAIEPTSGGILALVSKPTYDPNEILTGLRPEELEAINSRRDKPLFNRAVQGLYAPGSTFKPVVGITSLSEGVVDWSEVIVDKGNFSLPNSSLVYRSWNRTKTNPGGHGQVNMHRAIYRSANVYFYHLSTRLDVDVLANFAGRRFGLGRVTSMDIPEARAGVLPSRAWKKEITNESWYPGDSVVLSIGQGYISASPLQLATVATVFANRGAWVQPRMLKRSDQVLTEVASNPTPLTEVLETSDMAEHWQSMALAMGDVIHRGNKEYDQNGTAWAYIGMNIPYMMAGKSGTAQVISHRRDEEINVEELDEYERNHALFIAFAPIESPEIAVAVVVENGGGGSAIAAPIARAVIDAHMESPLVAQR